MKSRETLNDVLIREAHLFKFSIIISAIWTGLATFSFINPMNLCKGPCLSNRAFFLGGGGGWISWMPNARGTMYLRDRISNEDMLYGAMEALVTFCILYADSPPLSKVYKMFSTSVWEPRISRMGLVCVLDYSVQPYCTVHTRVAFSAPVAAEVWWKRGRPFG